MRAQRAVLPVDCASVASFVELMQRLAREAAQA